MEEVVELLRSLNLFDCENDIYDFVIDTKLLNNLKDKKLDLAIASSKEWIEEAYDNHKVDGTEISSNCVEESLKFVFENAKGVDLERV